MISQGIMFPMGQTPESDLSSTVLGPLLPEQWDSRGKGSCDRLLAKCIQQLPKATDAVECELQLSSRLVMDRMERTVIIKCPAWLTRKLIGHSSLCSW